VIRIVARALAALALLAGTARAHETRPAYLELRERDASTWEVRWKVPAAYKRLAWPNGQDKPCALVMYWTRGFIENARKMRR
jgi:hypothetical protein